MIPKIKTKHDGWMQYEKWRTSYHFQRAFNISSCKLLHRSSPPFSEGIRQHDIECTINLRINFDQKLWWKEQGDIVRYLVGGGNMDDDLEILSEPNNLSSSAAYLRKRFEQVYSSNAVYQDLFIDSPPCRHTLILCFELIHRYWEIEIVECASPTLITTIRNSTTKDDDKHKITNSNHHQETSHHFEDDVKLKEIRTKPRVGDDVVLRVSYTVVQRPRLSFLQSSAFDQFALFSFVKEKLFESEYEGWMDLYIRPIPAPSTDRLDDSDNDSNYSDDWKIINWKVYRHDDRLRVFPPQFVYRYIRGTNDSMNMDSPIDILTLVEKVPFISIVFQLFRRGHGMVVQHFAKKKFRNEIR